MAKMGISGPSVGILLIFATGGVYGRGGGFGGSTHRQPQIWIQKNFFEKFYKNIHITLIINYLFNRERYRTSMYWG